MAATVTHAIKFTGMREVGVVWAIPAGVTDIDLMAFGGPVEVMTAADDATPFRLPNGVLWPATAFLIAGDNVYLRGIEDATLGIIYRET